MKINNKIKSPLAWLWSIDVYFYAISFPVIQCIVNKQLNVALYAIPNLIISLFGGILDLKITEKNMMKHLYDHHFLKITLLDASVWIGYFALWLFEIVPDTWYPVASAIMHVSTVNLSQCIRSELQNRMFPESDEKTEFNNACSILCKMFNSLACIMLLLFSMQSFFIAKLILMFAMVVDNCLFVYIWRKFEKSSSFNLTKSKIGLY